LKTWHSEHIQFDILDIGVKGKRRRKPPFPVCPPDQFQKSSNLSLKSFKTNSLQNIAPERGLFSVPSR
jgi:hypothetical protein